VNVRTLSAHGRNVERSKMLLRTVLSVIFATSVLASKYKGRFGHLGLSRYDPPRPGSGRILNNKDMTNNILSELTGTELDNLLEDLHISKKQGDIILNKKQLVQKIANMELREHFSDQKYRTLPNEVDLNNRAKVMHQKSEHIKEVLKKYKMQHFETISQRKRVKRKMITGNVEKWVFPIQFSFNNTYTEENKTKIREALQNWEDATCASFIESNVTAAPALHFDPLDGCYSYVGREPSATNIVSLAEGCLTTGTIEHEIGHALGLFHEQSRPDRDSFITVNISNVHPDQASNYDILSWHETLTNNIEYDYGSVMQYNKRAFTGDGGITMIAKDDMFDNTMGQDAGLSFSDIKLFNIEYCS
ncbi:unnamed protein product, partial [Owenia fusiformis]